MTEYFFEIVEDGSVVIRGEKLENGIKINVNESIYEDIEAERYINDLLDNKTISVDWDIQIFK